jgi:hypothetical protein
MRVSLEGEPVGSLCDVDGLPSELLGLVRLSPACEDDGFRTNDRIAGRLAARYEVAR